MKVEIWKAVVGFDRYEVSDQGRVRNRRTQKILSPRTVRYPHVALSPGAVERTIHTLMLEAFVGPCPEGKQALHWDDVKTNNVLSNLRYGTAEDNCADATRNGAKRRGPSDLHDHRDRIRDLIRNGVSLAQIGAYLGMNRTTVTRIGENCHRNW